MIVTVNPEVEERIKQKIKDELRSEMGLQPRVTDLKRRSTDRPPREWQPPKSQVKLVHRRRRTTNLKQEFQDEGQAREYASQHHLLIVRSDKDRSGSLCLYYLPE